jgi:hypothetical protein
MKIDRELFEEWLANPVTEHVLAKVKETAEANKALWIQISWEGGDANPHKLIELKSRYQAGMDLSSITYEDVSDDESERDLPHGIQGADRAS